MSIIDQQIHSEIQYAMVEVVNNGSSYTSGSWTATEVSLALIRRQNRLLRETGVIVTRTTLVLIPETGRAVLPNNLQVTRRASWHNASGAYSPVWRMSWEEADAGSVSWEFGTAPTPTGYIEPEGLPTVLELQFVPHPSDAGIPNIWYIGLGTSLSNTGVAFTVPDELVATVKWGALADLLSKAGRAYDPDRAQFCEHRWAEGIELARLGMHGELK